MGEVIHRLRPETAEIGVQIRTGRVKSDPRKKPNKFKAVAAVLWDKPAAAIADIENCSLSTAKRILRDGELSDLLLLAVCLAMLKRE